jgi:hypothetical protein
MAARRRGFETLADMARSLGVVLVVVAIVFFLTMRTRGQSIRVVDVSGTYDQARIGAQPFTLVRPVGLDAHWRATSVYYDPPERTGVAGVTLWHVGYVTPSDQYAAMEQTNGVASAALVAAGVTAPAAAGSAGVAGVPWQRYLGDQGRRRALVRTVGTVTVIVDGTAGWPELEQLAGSLAG